MAEAKAKGGPSILTMWHFSAKAQPYREVLEAIREDKDESFFIQKCAALAGKLKFGKMEQKTFQEVMGKLEVFGEAVSQLYNTV